MTLLFYLKLLELIKSTIVDSALTSVNEKIIKLLVRNDNKTAC